MNISIETKTIMDDNKRITFDRYTGEVVEVMEMLEVEVEGVSSQEKRDTAKTVLDIEGLRNTDQIEDYIENNVDKRSMRLYDNLIEYHNESLGFSSRNGGGLVFQLPQLRLLEKLRPLIQYRNIIIVTRKKLASTLDTLEKHLPRNLRVGEPYLKFKTKGITRGYVKILVHPMLLFKYPRDGFSKARQQAILTWYDPTLVASVLDEPNKELIEVEWSDEMLKWLTSFSKAVQTKNSKKDYNKTL